MERRKFIKSSALSSALLATGAGCATAATPLAAKNEKHQFKLKYAPHLGMFKNTAGEDPIDQLNFMADQGFTAFEDNGMKGRDIELQEKMAQTMIKRGLEMGVLSPTKSIGKNRI